MSNTDVRFARTAWRRSSRSGGNGGACVEVATTPSITGVRDSKLGEASPVLPFANADWSAFLRAVKSGTFDH